MESQKLEKKDRTFPPMCRSSGKAGYNPQQCSKPDDPPPPPSKVRSRPKIPRPPSKRNTYSTPTHRYARVLPEIDENSGLPSLKAVHFSQPGSSSSQPSSQSSSKAGPSGTSHWRRAISSLFSGSFSGQPLFWLSSKKSSLKDESSSKTAPSGEPSSRGVRFGPPSRLKVQHPRAASNIEQLENDLFHISREERAEQVAVLTPMLLEDLFHASKKIPQFTQEPFVFTKSLDVFLHRHWRLYSLAVVMIRLDSSPPPFDTLAEVTPDKIWVWCKYNLRKMEDVHVNVANLRAARFIHYLDRLVDLVRELRESQCDSHSRLAMARFDKRREDSNDVLMDRYRIARAICQLNVVAILFGSHMNDGKGLEKDSITTTWPIMVEMFTGYEIHQMWSISFLLRSRLATILQPYIPKTQKKRLLDPYIRHILSRGMDAIYGVLFAEDSWARARTVFQTAPPGRNPRLPSQNEHFVGFFGDEILPCLMELVVEEDPFKNLPPLMRDVWGEDVDSERVWEMMQQRADCFHLVRMGMMFFDMDFYTSVVTNFAEPKPREVDEDRDEDGDRAAAA